MATRKLLRLREVTDTDIKELEKTIRKEDMRELLALGYPTVQVALKCAIHWTKTRDGYVKTAIWNNKVVAIYGIARPTMLSPMACPWSLTSTVVAKCPLAFHRTAKQLVDEWTDAYGVLQQYVDTRYRKAIDWLRSLGFSELDFPVTLSEPADQHVKFQIMERKRYGTTDLSAAQALAG